MTATLPDEVVYHVFSYLDLLSLARVLQCNTTFHRIATSPALWELPYLLRWSMGDEQREKERGTNEWRKFRKLQKLTLHARRAAAEMGLPSASTSASPFRHLLLDKQYDSSDPPHFELDFYRLFLERIHIDQQVLDTLYEQVEATSHRIPAVNSMARRFGSDAKDVLIAVIQAQSSCPSWSPNGIPRKKKSTDESDHQRRGKDALAYDTESYRVSAYQAHLPTTLRSDTHHLGIQYHAEQILEHLQRREAMDRMNKLARAIQHPTVLRNAESQSSDSPCRSLAKQTETAISLLSMFRGGEITYIEDQLDILAAACDLYIQQHPPPVPKATAKKSSARKRAEHMVLAICHFLADHGFRTAPGDRFFDLHNNFVHKCLTTSRECLPLSLTVIFCGIANRLGLATSLCNCPTTVIAVVMVDPSAPLPALTDTFRSAPQEMFWVLVSDYLTRTNEALEPTPTDAFARHASWQQHVPYIVGRDNMAAFSRSGSLDPSGDHWRPTRPDDMVVRATNNILQSISHESDLPEDLQTMQEIRDDRAREIEAKWRYLREQWPNLTRVDHAFLSSYHGRTDLVEQEKISRQVGTVLDGDTAKLAKGIDEDETTWPIVKTWRVESMTTLLGRPADWTMPAAPLRELFRRHLEARAKDNDWTNIRTNIRTNLCRYPWTSEHELSIAKYVAFNVMLRLRMQFSAREGELLVVQVQKAFPLDLEVIETDLLGIVHEDAAQGTAVGDDAASDGSDSSNETTFSSRGVSDGTVPPRGFLARTALSQGSHTTIARMLQTRRLMDCEEPRICRRARAESRLKQGLGAFLKNAAADGEANAVTYRVGTIFRHRTSGYTGHILGWDPYCKASEDWIVRMGVDRLPAPSVSAVRNSAASSWTWRRGGRHQPFYHSYTGHEHGIIRYVAEVNVEPISGPIWIYGVPPDEARHRLDGGESKEEKSRLRWSLHEVMQDRAIGRYFRCFDQTKGRFRRAAFLREKFPDDGSDVEAEDDNKKLAPWTWDVEHVEVLSEDGHW